MISAGEITQTTDPSYETGLTAPKAPPPQDAPVSAGQPASPATDGQQSAFVPSDQVPKAPEAKGPPVSKGAYGSGNKASANQPVTIEITPEILALADSMNIPREQVPHLLSEAGKTSQENIAKIVEERFTPERLEKWLDSDKGKEWYETNQAKIADTMRNRLKIGGVGLLFGIAGLLGAEQVADVIGLKPLYNTHERFAFIVYSMHSASIVGHAAGEAIFERPLIEILKRETVEVGGQQVLNVTLLRKPMPLHRAFFNALGRNFAGKSAAELGKGAFAMPFEAVTGLGPGLMASKIFDSTIGELLPEGAIREWSSFGAFFIPDLYNLVARNRISNFLVRYTLGKKLLESGVGKVLGIGSTVFAAAFALDLGTLALYRLTLGSGGAAYQSSVDMRVQQIIWNEDKEALKDRGVIGKAFYGNVLARRKMLELLAGPFSAAIERFFVIDNPFGFSNPLGTDYELMIYAEDEQASAKTRDDIRAKLLSVLVKGFGDESDSPEFYKDDIDLSMFHNEIEPEGKTEKLFDTLAELEKDEELKEKIVKAILDDAEEDQELKEKIPEEISAVLEKHPELKEKIPEEILAVLEKHTEFKEEIDKRQSEIIKDKMEEIMPEGEEQKILVELNAKRIQSSLAFLYFMHIHENDDIRTIVDEDGVIQSVDPGNSLPDECGNDGGTGKGHDDPNAGVGGGSTTGGAGGGDGAGKCGNNNTDPVVSEEQEDAFLKLAFPNLEASEIRDKIFMLRKTGLLIRILGARGSEKKKLLRLANKAGLTDPSGKLKKDKLYYEALDQWSKAAKETGKGTGYRRYVDHKRDLLIQMETTPNTDQKKKVLLNIEYVIMEDGLEKVRSMIAPKKAKEPSLREQQMEIMADYFDAKVKYLRTGTDEDKYAWQDLHYKAVAKGIAIDYSNGGYKMLYGNGNELYMEGLKHWVKLATVKPTDPRYDENRHNNYVGYKAVIGAMLEATPEHDENWMLYTQEYSALNKLGQPAGSDAAPPMPDIGDVPNEDPTKDPYWNERVKNGTM